MIQILRNMLMQVSDGAARYALFNILAPIAHRFRSCGLNSAGLTIKAGGSTLIKTAGFHYVSEGVKGRILTNVDMPALVGTVTNTMFNVFVFSVDKTGVVTVQMGIEGATEAALRWPKLDQRKAVVGLAIINPTGTGPFIGGTTPLDDATVVPNMVCLNPVGAFDPQIVTGAANL